VAGGGYVVDFKVGQTFGEPQLEDFINLAAHENVIIVFEHDSLRDGHTGVRPAKGNHQEGGRNSDQQVLR